MVSSVEHGARMRSREGSCDVSPRLCSWRVCQGYSIGPRCCSRRALCSSVTVGACDSFVSLTSCPRFIEKKKGDLEFADESMHIEVSDQNDGQTQRKHAELCARILCRPHVDTSQHNARKECRAALASIPSASAGPLGGASCCWVTQGARHSLALLSCPSPTEIWRTRRITADCSCSAILASELSCPVSRSAAAHFRLQRNWSPRPATDNKVGERLSMWTSESSCSKGGKCSFEHDLGKKGKGKGTRSRSPVERGNAAE